MPAPAWTEVDHFCMAREGGQLCGAVVRDGEAACIRHRGPIESDPITAKSRLLPWPPGFGVSATKRRVTA